MLRDVVTPLGHTVRVVGTATEAIRGEVVLADLRDADPQLPVPSGVVWRQINSIPTKQRLSRRR
jgi:hypothetical protein